MLLHIEFSKIVSSSALLWDGPLQKALAMQRKLMKIHKDLESGLPSDEDVGRVIGHIRGLIRQYGETLSGSKHIGDKELPPLYNNLCDATSTFLMHWSRNRKHEVESLRKDSYLSAKIRDPLSSKII